MHHSKQQDVLSEKKSGTQKSISITLKIGYTNCPVCYVLLEICGNKQKWKLFFQNVYFFFECFVAKYRRVFRCMSMLVQSVYKHFQAFFFCWNAKFIKLKILQRKKICNIFHIKLLISKLFQSIWSISTDVIAAN